MLTLHNDLKVKAKIPLRQQRRRLERDGLLGKVLAFATIKT